MISNPVTSREDLPDDVEDKNRFANVIPNSESRVPIVTPNLQPAYINANFIKVKPSIYHCELPSAAWFCTAGVSGCCEMLHSDASASGSDRD